LIPLYLFWGCPSSSFVVFVRWTPSLVYLIEVTHYHCVLLSFVIYYHWPPFLWRPPDLVSRCVTSNPLGRILTICHTQLLCLLQLGMSKPHATFPSMEQFHISLNKAFRISMPMFRPLFMLSQPCLRAISLLYLSRFILSHIPAPSMFVVFCNWHWLWYAEAMLFLNISAHCTSKEIQVVCCM